MDTEKMKTRLGEVMAKVKPLMSNATTNLAGRDSGSERNADYKLCRFYGYSVFVVSIICFAVLLFWASPGNVDFGYGQRATTGWNKGLITSAITQLIECAIWGCFIFSQISCAGKLRDRPIVPGSAPVYLLVVRYLCVLLAGVVAAGILHLLIGDVSKEGVVSDLAAYLTLANIPLLVGAAGHCKPQIAISLSAVVTIWHLLGAGYVAMLIRDNIAKIQSLENANDK